MISKWYRGHNGKQKATDNFGIIWLADNPEYAQLYADEYGNEGVVSVFYIDESKLNCADTYYNDNFDVYDPDMREVKEYQKEGYNCYTFPVDMGDTDVLALFDESAIVKIEQMNKSKNIMENKIKLTEAELKKIISESVKKVLSEIGDTPRGQYALGAVKGRAAARGRYQNSKFGGAKQQAKLNQTINNAADAAYNQRKNMDNNKYREMDNAEQRGYYYGFEKGMTN